MGIKEESVWKSVGVFTGKLLWCYEADIGGAFSWMTRFDAWGDFAQIECSMTQRRERDWHFENRTQKFKNCLFLLQMLVCMQESEEGPEVAGTGVSGGWELQFEFWKVNWVPNKGSIRS